MKKTIAIHLNQSKVDSTHERTICIGPKYLYFPNQEIVLEEYWRGGRKNPKYSQITDKQEIEKIKKKIEKCPNRQRSSLTPLFSGGHYTTIKNNKTRIITLDRKIGLKRLGEKRIENIFDKCEEYMRNQK